MALSESQVPPLPRGFGALSQYLMNRDSGEPDVAPATVALTQTAVGDQTLDVIAWTQPVSRQGLEPDGFLIWWAASDTADPTDGGVKVSASSRRFTMLWPEGGTRSYAVSAYRQTWQGEVAGPKVQDTTWKGVA